MGRHTVQRIGFGLLALASLVVVLPILFVRPCSYRASARSVGSF